MDHQYAAAADFSLDRHCDGIGMEGVGMSRPGVIIYWHRSHDTKTIVTDEPESWINTLKQQDAFFEVFVPNGSVPIPSNPARRS